MVACHNIIGDTTPAGCLWWWRSTNTLTNNTGTNNTGTNNTGTNSYVYRRNTGYTPYSGRTR